MSKTPIIMDVDTGIDDSQYKKFYHSYSQITPIYMDGEEIRP